ncbi:TPA: DNRLRE domain-containing protein, partial [Candidatus Bipolaricaulota bacterium]|nr:DNRLRE domain-containing protein [Candidatus Bipolaricaulota bacterium]
DRKGESPSGFITFGGKWIIDREAGMRVCRQLEDETPLSFNENAYAIVQWRNYTVRVRMRADRARTVWGYGIVGYYTLDDTGEHFYRLWQARGVVMLDKRDGKRTDHFGSAPLRCERGKWYTFLMRLQEEEGGVLIRAKVWDDGPEPKDWLLEHYDPKPLAGGQAGILVFRAECSFDDFTVLRNSGTSRFRTVVLQNHWGGYEGCEEVGVISSASPDANQRNSPIFRITRKDGTVTRGLLHFDLSVLPAGGIVRRATLMLYALRREGEPTVGVFRLLKRWLPDRVTWLSPDGRRRWDTPGGDFPGDGNNPAHLSFQPGSQYGEESAVKITHAPRWWAFDITEAVRSWVEGAVANYGLVLTIVEGNGMVEFATSRITSTETSIAPRLFIEYEVRQPLEPWHSPLEYWQAVMQRKGLLTGPPRGFYPNGIMGEYYDDPDAKEYQMDKEPPGPVFTKLIFTRPDEMINFVWNTGRAPHPEMGSEFWSVRWQGRLFVPRDDEYKFYFDNLDDAARLYIDGKLILDAWKIQLPSTHASEPIKLTAGFHQVVVEYHQGPGPGAAIRLSWSGTNLPKQVVVFPEGIKGDYYDDPAYNEYELNQPPPGPFF